jgi:hypothetical protein
MPALSRLRLLTRPVAHPMIPFSALFFSINTFFLTTIRHYPSPTASSALYMMHAPSRLPAVAPRLIFMFTESQAFFYFSPAVGLMTTIPQDRCLLYR